MNSHYKRIGIMTWVTEQIDDPMWDLCMENDNIRFRMKMSDEYIQASEWMETHIDRNLEAYYRGANQ